MMEKEEGVVVVFEDLWCWWLLKIKGIHGEKEWMKEICGGDRRTVGFAETENTGEE